MHTVIIAEKHLIDDINNYPVFFNPFLAEGDITFCAWDPLEDKVESAVPDLGKAASALRDWRAIIVCDEISLQKKNKDNCCGGNVPATDANEAALGSKNPFDVISDLNPDLVIKEKGLDKGNFDSIASEKHLARINAFECAAQQPLTQLVTLLCEEPETGEGTTSKNEGETADGQKDTPEGEKPDDCQAVSEYDHYREEAQKKHELRQEILKGTPVHFNRPSEVLCIAKSDYIDNAETLCSAWTAHDEIDYSDFYDYNLYFDKMRYLLLDASFESGETPFMNNFKFLYSLMLIASNPLPKDCLNPNRVYLAESSYDQSAFEKTLTQYYDQLTATAHQIEDEIQSLSSFVKKHLTDIEAENLLHSHITIPVSLTDNFDKDTLTAKYDDLGLSGDCPVDEMSKWNEEEKKTTNALLRYLKQPRRALKKAARDAREMARINEDAASCLDDFQTDDLEAVMENNEVEMVSAGIPNVFDERRYRASVDEAGEAVRAKIRTRMSRKCTIGLGVCVLALFLIGLLPMWLGSLSEPLVIPGALIMMAVALVLLAATGFVCLFFLRRSLIQKWEDYNYAMQETVNEIRKAVSQSSRYLSLVCRFMQEHSALERAKNQELPNKSKCLLLKRHLSDIYNQRESVYNIFGDFVDTSEPEADTPVYEYNFLRARSYEYPLPESHEFKEYVTFMEKDIQVEVPYKLLESLTVRREEIYD